MNNRASPVDPKIGSGDEDPAVPHGSPRKQETPKIGEPEIATSDASPLYSCPDCRRSETNPRNLVVFIDGTLNKFGSKVAAHRVASWHKLTGAGRYQTSESCLVRLNWTVMTLSSINII